MYNDLDKVPTQGEARSGPMAELHDARRVPSGPPEEGMSPEALYNQGMAYYRRRQWQKARESFQRLKRLEPGRRGIDALLDELDIFIRLESLEPAPVPREPVEPEPQVVLAPVAPEPLDEYPDDELAPRTRPGWLLPILLLALVAFAVAGYLVYGRFLRAPIDRAEYLRNLGQAYRTARNWPKAIEAYDELLRLVPNDLEGKNGLWISYYEYGDQLSGEAQVLEGNHEYQKAADKWRAGLQQFMNAQSTDPHHRQDPRGTLAQRIATAEKHMGWAELFAQAEQARKDRRWPDAIRTLETLREQAPDYRSAEVRTYLSDCCLEAGEEAIAMARTVGEVQEGIKLLERAFAEQPSNSRAQPALQRARSYVQAITGIQDRQWDKAIELLQAVLKEESGYRSQAREMLCYTYLQRATELHQAGKLREAYADYQAIVTLGECSQRAEAEQKASEVALALTPTITPTRLPTRTPAPTRPPTATPQPTATPRPTEPPPPPPPPTRMIRE